MLLPLFLVRAANATLTASQTLRCKDIDHCRTLQSIIFSCLSTVFLCTWTALHLNVPRNPNRPGPFRRLWFILGALAAPEVVFGYAYCHWIESSAMLYDILENLPTCGWTEIHAQFARMGGFRLKYSDGETELIRCRELFDLVREGTIDLPAITEEDILERSKGDPIATGLTVLQTVWFIIQFIYRMSQSLPTTALEITTLSYTLVNLFIYWCWWYKPQRVRYPIDILSKKSQLERIRGQDISLVSSQNRSEEDIITRFFKPDNNNYGDEIREALADVLTFMSRRDDTDRPLSVTEFGERSKSSDAHTLVASSSTHHKVDKDDAHPIPVPKLDVETTKNVFRPLSLRVRLGTKLSSATRPKNLSLHGRIFYLILFFIVGGSFGSLLCLGWNSEFPTRVERYLWQAMSLTVVAIGGAMMVLASNTDDTDFWGNPKKAGPYIVLIMIFFYSAARMLLFILALLQLRSLPYAAYVSPSWLLYYAHIN